MSAFARSPKLGPLMTAMLTPFDAADRVDLAEARRLARFLVDEGNHGLVVCGTTGETPALTEREQLALLEAVKDEVGDRAGVMAGTGSNSTAALERAAVRPRRTELDSPLARRGFVTKVTR